MKTGPLAQDYVVVGKTPAADLITDDPALTKLPGGGLLATWTYRGTVGETKNTNPERFRLARSDDGGRTWEELAPLEITMGLPFVHDGELYLLGNAFGRRNIIISRSRDAGQTWRPFTTLFEGEFWNTPTGTAVRDGIWYRAFGVPNNAGVYNQAGSRTVVLAGDLSRDLLDPRTWRLSNLLTYPGTPPELRTGVFGEYEDHWLEPNVVNVNGRIRVLARPRIDGYATSGIAAVCDVDDDGRRLNYRFTQFHPFPGGQNKFHIIYDRPSRLFWMTGNLPTNSQDTELAAALKRRGFSGRPGNERRFLMLFYSIDALNWFHACCLAAWPSPLQSFHYVTPLVDGENLLFLSRTSKDAPNQHDSELVTFHRLAGFRSLALDLHQAL
jgi:hypothetical protein